MSISRFFNNNHTFIEATLVYVCLISHVFYVYITHSLCISPAFSCFISSFPGWSFSSCLDLHPWSEDPSSMHSRFAERHTHKRYVHWGTPYFSGWYIWERWPSEGNVNSESVPTTLRLDFVLWSLGKYVVELFELWEENVLKPVRRRRQRQNAGNREVFSEHPC